MINRYLQFTFLGLEWNRPTCSYDYECPGAEKCCHTEIKRGLFTMRCRYPSRDYYYKRK